ncbi:MAG: methylated-DNA--[protein]-cysteine S-methyltransferase [Deltaproteobacteria bacterium]|nr:methylated-DNA--[protein]-cysteine S-methyltransferase [Deltaproteobacteria bacterium]
MNYFWDIYHSDWGDILLISSHKGLLRLSLPSQDPKKILDAFMIQSDGILTHHENSTIEKTKKQLHQYFNQQRKNFFIPLDLVGTDFQKSVWHALRGIAFGQTVSYQEIAQQIDCPNGSRAVGMANHHNPIPIIIPCHRVISKNGLLGGFADNTQACLSLKQALLDLEKTTLDLDYTGSADTSASVVFMQQSFSSES